MAIHRTKSGAAARHKAARPTQSRAAGKRSPEPKRPGSDETMSDSRSGANARSSRDEPAPRVKPGVDQRDFSSTDESSARNPTRGSRWERADEDTMIGRPDDPLADDAPLADSDEAPEGSER